MTNLENIFLQCITFASKHINIINSKVVSCRFRYWVGLRDVKYGHAE